MSILDSELQSRTLLYGSFMQRQFSALQRLPGFQELPLPPSLGRQLSSKHVPSPPRPLDPFPSPKETHPPGTKFRPQDSFLLEDPTSAGGDLATSARLSSASASSSTSASSIRDEPWGEGDEREEGAWFEGGGSGRREMAERNRTEGRGMKEMAPRGKIQPLVRSWVFQTEHLRRARFTYFDGGTAVQAFNSLCYPQDWLDLPLLGIDLLSFGESKLLCVVDLQPVTSSHHSSERAEQSLSSLKAKYGDSLFQKMTTRFFDESRFFSPHMLLLRSSLGWHEPLVQAPHGALFEAVNEHLRLYEHLLTSAPVLTCPKARARVRQGQGEYDEYFKATDPAIPMFTTYFGEEWSERYADHFLFPWADLGAAKELFSHT